MISRAPSRDCELDDPGQSVCDSKAFSPADLSWKVAGIELSSCVHDPAAVSSNRGAVWSIVLCDRGNPVRSYRVYRYLGISTLYRYGYTISVTGTSATSRARWTRASAVILISQGENRENVKRSVLAATISTILIDRYMVQSFALLSVSLWRRGMPRHWNIAR